MTFHLKAFSFKLIPYAKNDTSIENTNSTKPQIVITDSIAYKLLNTHPAFTNFWDNNYLFVYKTVKFADIGDTIALQLLNPEDKFKLNWYGSISSSYGRRWGRKHEGLDIPLHTGDSVVSSFDGVVRFARCTNSGYGNCIIVRHLNGLETLYGHLSKIEVSENQFVKSGELIGLGGSTGKSTGPHLHFETRLYDYSFNPNKIIDISNRQLVNSAMVFTKKELFPEHFYTEPPSKPIIKKEKSNKSKATTKSKKNEKKKGKKEPKTTKGSKKENPKKSKKESTEANSKKKKTNSKAKTSKKETNSNTKSKKANQKSASKKEEPKKAASKKSKTIPPKKPSQTKSKKKKG